MYVSPAEYYARERLAVYKSEYFKGVIYPMVSGTSDHSGINANIIATAGNRLKRTTFRMLESSMRLNVESTGFRTYPDCAIYPEKLEFDREDSERETVTNPIVIFEVLSVDTESRDRGFRFEHFRQIPSLKTYVLTSQQKPRVEVFARRPDNLWELRDYVGLDAVAVIPEPKIELPLSEVYDRVDLTLPE